MNISDYDVKPFDRRQIERQFRALAASEPLKAERLVRALEEFVQQDTTASCCVGASPNGGYVEVFMVPTRKEVALIPDAVAVVKVDHPSATISITYLDPDYGIGREAADWQAVQRAAQAAIMKL